MSKEQDEKPAVEPLPDSYVHLGVRFVKRSLRGGKNLGIVGYPGPWQGGSGDVPQCPQGEAQKP